MVALVGVYILAIAAMAWLVWRRGTDDRPRLAPGGRWLMVLAAVPLILQAAVLAFFGVGEMAGGDVSGASHLLTLLPPLALGYLAWRRPVEGGVALFLASLPLLGLLPADQAPVLTIMILPGLVAGLLFLLAGMRGRGMAVRHA